MTANPVTDRLRQSARGRILLLDDDEVFRETLAMNLSYGGFDVRPYASADQAMVHLDSDSTPFDVALVDLRMPRIDGMVFLRQLRGIDPSLHIIMITAYGDVPTAVEALKAGAADFLQKPVSTEFLLAKLDRICAIRKAHASGGKDTAIVCQSAVMRQLLTEARQVAPAPSGILIVGETGVGKELLARHIHRHSGRKGAFVPVNAAAIPRELVAAELFGHKKGAFTGAVGDRAGLFVAAHGGTLFLDEIGDMPLEQQPNLLRTLQDRRVRPVGSSEETAVDVRILAATSLDPEEAVSSGRIRQDLFYRLCVVVLRVPPLRERKEDIPSLVMHMLGRIRPQLPDTPDSVSQDLLHALARHDWPGNVRELQNVVMRMALGSASRELTVSNLPPDFSAAPVTGFHPLIDPRRLMDIERRVSLPDILDRVEREIVQWAMILNDGNRTKAAEMLRIPRSTLKEKLKKIP